MPIEEAKKRELVAGITAILRQSPLHTTIDTQRLALAFSMVLDNVEPGQPIDLQHLYQWLISQNAPEKDALELCVVLKLREDKLGAPFTAPAKAQYMEPAVLEALAARFQTKAERSQAWDKKAAEQPLPASLGEKKDPGWRPKKGGKDNRKRNLLITFATVVLSGVGFWSWMLGTVKEPMRPVALTDPAGLKCVEIKANADVAFCKLTRQVYAAETKEGLAARADVTLRELRKGKGIKILYVAVEDRVKLRRT